MKHFHVNLSLTLNEDDWSYQEPKVSDSLVFSIPEELLSSKLLTDAITSRLEEMRKKLPVRAKEWEAEQARIEAEKEVNV